MASKRHVCERRGWSGFKGAPSERREKKQREAARHLIRVTHLQHCGAESARWRKDNRKILKAVRKEAMARAFEMIPEPEAA